MNQAPHPAHLRQLASLEIDLAHARCAYWQAFRFQLPDPLHRQVKCNIDDARLCRLEKALKEIDLNFKRWLPEQLAQSPLHWRYDPDLNDVLELLGLVGEVTILDRIRTLKREHVEQLAATEACIDALFAAALEAAEAVKP